MEILNSILDFGLWLVALPGQVPPSVWAFIGTSLGVSVLMQTIKHKFEMENPKTIAAITTVLSGFAALLELVMLGLQSNPELFGQYSMVTLGISTLVYRYMVQPGYNFMLDVKEYQEQKKSGKLTEVAKTATPEAPVFNPIIADEFDG